MCADPFRALRSAIRVCAASQLSGKRCAVDPDQFPRLLFGDPGRRPECDSPNTERGDWSNFFGLLKGQGADTVNYTAEDFRSKTKGDICYAIGLKWLKEQIIVCGYLPSSCFAATQSRNSSNVWMTCTCICRHNLGPHMPMCCV